MNRIAGQLSGVTYFEAGTADPILMCEECAIHRGIDLMVAAADAKHWWATGQIPLRVTPNSQNDEHVESPVTDPVVVACGACAAGLLMISIAVILRAVTTGPAGLFAAIALALIIAAVILSRFVTQRLEKSNAARE